LLGIEWFGFLLSSPSIPLYFGLLSMGLWLQERRWLVGDTWVIVHVSSVELVLKAKPTSSFLVASVIDFGKLL
jgi:hypothetical protein